MAASLGSAPDTSPGSAPTAVPTGFRYETKYIVLNYLGLLPPSQTHVGQGDDQRNRVMKAQIEDELRRLEDEISASFSSTGFDCQSSPVFSPADPDSSVEDCLAVLGDRVAQDLDAHLGTAVHTLLSGPLDYGRFRDTALEISCHTQGGWNKVLVPLVLLQALQGEGQSLSSLLPLGIRYLEETEADYIIQQGGWGTVFSLEEEEAHGTTITEDSNDIYILSGEQLPEQPSPPAPLLVGDSSGPSSWQTDSLPASLAGHESWAQVGLMDHPEDVKSLDSNEGAALAEERSENNSSNSDIVHVEREEAELLEEGGVEESMMSVLGTDSELAELRAELRDATPPPHDADALPASPEEPVVVVEAAASLAAAAPVPLPTVEAEVLAPTPEPAPAPVEDTPPPPAKSPPTPPPPATTDPQPEPEPVVSAPPPQPEETPEEPQPPAETVPEPEATPLLAAPPTPAPPQEIPSEQPPAETEPDPDSGELPVLLYGGAALVAIAAVVAYTCLTYRRK